LDKNSFRSDLHHLQRRMTMKKSVHLSLSVLCIFLLIACEKEKTQSSPEVINPGDKIGNFLITTGDSEGVTFMTFLHCAVSNDTETCEVPVGTKINVSNGIYDPDLSSGMNLDELWSDHTYEMSIEGYPVNLKAFGSIDKTHPYAGIVRHWNVVVVSDKPGKVTTNYSSVVGEDPYKGTFVVVFKAP